MRLRKLVKLFSYTDQVELLNLIFRGNLILSLPSFFFVESVRFFFEGLGQRQALPLPSSQLRVIATRYIERKTTKRKMRWKTRFDKRLRPEECLMKRAPFGP